MVYLRVAVCNPCSVQMHIASCLNTDSSCPAINLNKDLVLDAKLGVSTQYDWAKVTCHTKLPFICAVKVKASEQLRMHWEYSTVPLSTLLLN